MMGTDLSIQKAKFVLAKLKKKNVSVIKRSELFQMCRGKVFKKTEEIFPTLELLEGHGYIRLEEPERQSGGQTSRCENHCEPRHMKPQFSAFIAFPAQSCTLVSHHRPHRKIRRFGDG